MSMSSAMNSRFQSDRFRARHNAARSEMTFMSGGQDAADFKFDSTETDKIYSRIRQERK